MGRKIAVHLEVSVKAPTIVVDTTTAALPRMTIELLHRLRLVTSLNGATMVSQLVNEHQPMVIIFRHHLARAAIPFPTLLHVMGDLQVTVDSERHQEIRISQATGVGKVANVVRRGAHETQMIVLVREMAGAAPGIPVILVKALLLVTIDRTVGETIATGTELGRQGASQETGETVELAPEVQSGEITGIATEIETYTGDRIGQFMYDFPIQSYLSLVYCMHSTYPWIPSGHDWRKVEQHRKNRNLFDLGFNGVSKKQWRCRHRFSVSTWRLAA